MTDLPTDPAERLRLAAAGRREYARCANEADRVILEAQAAAYETAARILTDDTLLELVIPSWSFAEREHVDPLNQAQEIRDMCNARNPAGPDSSR